MSASSNPRTDRVVIPGSERVAPADAVLVGVPNPNERDSVTVMVRSRNPSHETVEAMPADPARRRYLSAEEFAAKHGADPADVLAVERFALEKGLLVLEASLARRSVVLEGTVRALAAAFDVQLVLFRRGEASFRGRTGVLTIPASLDGIVCGVFGLDERPQARAQFRPAAASNVSFTPPQVARAYDFPGGVNGQGQTIALIELGGGYAQSDLDTYFQGLGIAAPVVTSVGVDGATNAPTGDPNSADGEVLLDIEVAGSIAPGAKLVVYFAPNTDQGFLDAITTAIHDSSNKPAVVSISWGGAESTWTAQATSNFDAAFADAATLGITVCTAAGDNGSSDGVSDGLAHVDFPSSSPHVLACGGTHLLLSGGTIASETVWNDTSAGAGATGGGISDVFPLPSWQANAGVPPSANPGGRVGRGVPDVAGDASPETGYQTKVDGQSGVVGGTSAVAPLWAALTVLLNQSLGSALGPINPLLYARTSAFNDVTTGNNGAYAARPGWDACTGLGSPDGSKLLAALRSS